MKQTKKNKLAILFLEDNQNDVELCLYELKKSKRKISHRIIDSKNQFIYEVKNHTYDIIIADYQLPNWTGFDALKWLRTNGFSIPFILVTGAVGEETAVECIRQGADNYILKNNLTRLLPAIEQALNASQMRIEHEQAFEDLIESEVRLEAIFNSAIDAIFSKNVKGQFTRVNQAFKQMHRRDEKQIIGKTVFDLFPKPVAQVYTRMDQIVFLGNATSKEVIHIKHGRQLILQVNQTPLRGKNDQIIGIVGFVRDISERKNALQRIKMTMEGSVRAIMAIVEQKDPYTSGHQLRVSELSTAIARKMQLPEDQIEGLRMAAMMHDVGKASLPAEILSKPAQLSEPERMIMQTHSELGANILRQIPFPWDLARFVEEHHERLDGSGYPRGLMWNKISLEARIIGVADLVDSICSHRPYRPAKTLQEALEELKEGMGIKYDPEIIIAFFKLVDEGYFENRKDDPLMIYNQTKKF